MAITSNNKSNSNNNYNNSNNNSNSYFQPINAHIQICIKWMPYITTTRKSRQHTIYNAKLRKYNNQTSKKNLKCCLVWNCASTTEQQVIYAVSARQIQNHTLSVCNIQSVAQIAIFKKAKSFIVNCHSTKISNFGSVEPHHKLKMVTPPFTISIRGNLLKLFINWTKLLW